MPAELRPQVLVGLWSRAVMRTLQAQGVQDVVLCPGSRNTPLIWAALQSEGLRLHSVLDERSAGFFALGLARASGRPSVVCCTSGTALGHFLPAVMEAQASDVPLMVLSADRPARLQGVGAAQTLEQPGALGTFAPTFGPWLEPEAKTESFSKWIGNISAALATCWKGQSPVHLNVPLDKPLEPLAPELPQELEFAAAVETLLAQNVAMPTEGLRGQAIAQPDAAALRQLCATLQQGDGPLILSLGPCAPEEAAAARALAAHWKVPLVSEFGSLGQSSPVQAWAARWSAQKRQLRILHIGLPMLAGTWSALLAQEQVQYWCLPGQRLRDPEQRARGVVQGALLPQLQYLTQLASPHAAQGAREQPAGEHCAREQGVAEDCAEHEVAATSPRSAVELDELNAAQALLYGAAGHAEQAPGLSELSMMQLAHRAMPQCAHNIFYGNSLSVRLGAWSSALSQDNAHQRHVYTCRGVNGIDGTLAQAAGIARATERPTLCVLGDVSAAHDISSLLTLRDSGAPVVVLINDNQGGHIFDHLPGAALWPQDARAAGFFQTPPRLDWQPICQGFGLKCSVVDAAASLTAALSTAWLAAPEVIVARTNPESTKLFLSALRG